MLSRNNVSSEEWTLHPLMVQISWEVFVRVIPAAESSPVADPLEMGPPLSSERHDVSSTA